MADKGKGKIAKSAKKENKVDVPKCEQGKDGILIYTQGNCRVTMDPKTVEEDIAVLKAVKEMSQAKIKHYRDVGDLVAEQYIGKNDILIAVNGVLHALEGNPITFNGCIAILVNLAPKELAKLLLDTVTNFSVMHDQGCVDTQVERRSRFQFSKFLKFKLLKLLAMIQSK